jgi:hypothetical protein
MIFLTGERDPGNMESTERERLMDRGNHYEAAFEAYLRDARLPYVAVDETRRATLDDEPIKSLDFIVHGVGDAKLLVDVKGRKFPGGNKDKPSYSWQNWSTLDDVSGLGRWEQRFGPGYTGLLVFIYQLTPIVDLPPGTPDLWHWRERRYLMRAIPVSDYRGAMRKRSEKWGTVSLPTQAFRDLVRPFRDFTHPLLVVD